MKSRNVIQALWPGLWLVGFITQLFTRGDVYLIPMIVVLGVWFHCAASLHPQRRWSWWACLAPLAFAASFGLLLLVSLIHMALFPDSNFWADANQPGALAIIGGLFFLVPSSLLLWHLLAIRSQFYESANAK